MGAAPASDSGGNSELKGDVESAAQRESAAGIDGKGGTRLKDDVGAAASGARRSAAADGTGDTGLKDSAVAEGRTRMRFVDAAEDGAKLKEDNGAETLMPVAAGGSALKPDVGTDAPGSSAGRAAPGCGWRVEDRCCSVVLDEVTDRSGRAAVSSQTPQLDFQNKSPCCDMDLHSVPQVDADHTGNYK